MRVDSPYLLFAEYPQDGLSGEWRKEMKEMKITLYKGRMVGACDLTDEDDGLEVHSTDKVDGDSLIRKGESMMKPRQSRANTGRLWTWSFSLGYLTNSC